MVGWRIGDGSQVECQGKVDRITRGRGGFEERQSVFKVIGVGHGDGVTTECANSRNVERGCCILVVQEDQEGRWAGNGGGADPHRVRQVEQAALKTAIYLKRAMESGPPFGVREISIDSQPVPFRQQPTDPMALDNAAGPYQVGKLISHPILIGCDAGHRGQLQRHEIPEVHLLKSSQQRLECPGMTEMKRVVERAFGLGRSRRQGGRAMLRCPG